MKMIRNILKSTALIILGTCLAAACSKSSEEGANDAAKRYFDAWRAIHYPDAVQKDGIYIIEDIPGTGAAWDMDTEIALATYTIRSLDGSVSSNTEESWAKKLGNWNQTYYYGPQVIITSGNSSYAGVEMMLDGMREGGTRTAIIPAWLMTQTRYENLSDYLEVDSGNSAAIYTINLKGVTNDLPEYEYRQMREYAIREWGVSDTLSTAAVFFKSHTDFDGEPAEMPKDTTVYINYIGRRMDGQVFDTSIADTAKFYHIYDSSKEYAPVSITYAEEAKDIKMGSSAPVGGFQYGLAAMHPGEKASFLFGYALGYGTTAKSKLIPAYSALRFDIEMVEKP